MDDRLTKLWILRFIILYILLLFDVTSSTAQLLYEAKRAVALNKVTLYSDSTFFVHSNTFYPEGTLFEVLRATHQEQEDEAQNQKFRWYQVRTRDGQTGWVFGDGIAVAMEKEEIPTHLRSWQGKQVHFTGEFAQSVIWFAVLDGSDNFYEEDYLNPRYQEVYLVVSSERSGVGVPFQIGGESTQGVTTTASMQLEDLTGDSYAELIFLQETAHTGKTLRQQQLDIYAFQSGSFTKVLEESLHLTSYYGQRSPAQAKFVEISEEEVRVVYVDYLPCSRYQQAINLPHSSHPDLERCLEYVTYSYWWNKEKQQYENLYKESRLPVTGKLAVSHSFLRTAPSYLSEVEEKIFQETPLTIIQQFTKKIRQRGQVSEVPYLLVQSPAGKIGYLHAREVDFTIGEHDDILNDYYQSDTPYSHAIQDFLVLKNKNAKGKTLVVDKNGE